MLDQRVGGQGDDGHLGEGLGQISDAASDINTIHDRHLDVHQDQIEPLASGTHPAEAAYRIRVCAG